MCCVLTEYPLTSLWYTVYLYCLCIDTERLTDRWQNSRQFMYVEDIYAWKKILRLYIPGVLHHIGHKNCKMWSDSLLIVFISICTAFLGEGKTKTNGVLCKRNCIDFYWWLKKTTIYFFFQDWHGSWYTEQKNIKNWKWKWNGRVKNVSDISFKNMLDMQPQQLTMQLLMPKTWWIGTVFIEILVILLC